MARGRKREMSERERRLREMAMEIVKDLGFEDAILLPYEEAMRVSPMGTTRKG